jgi:hypothetical protein
MTGEWQPLDVMVNRVMKALFRAEYHRWRKTHFDVTKSNYLKKPTRQDFINMVSAAWKKVDMECIRKSFIKAEIVDKSADCMDFGQIVCEDENSSFIEISFFEDSDFIAENDIDL